jgi:uncharacterized protein (DUF169 family)
MRSRRQGIVDFTRAAEVISSELELGVPPVAVTFVEAVPEGVRVFDEDVPSACTFWRRAELDVFYAPAEKHFNCPVGAMTMGFDMPEAVQRELMGLVEDMAGCGYIAPEEAANIPTVSKKKSGIVYGPLKNFPVEPDLILLWLTPTQAMLFTEAVGTSRWTEPSATAVFGRPSCAALPIALDKSTPTLSFGCIGMRTFTEISQDRLLAAVPWRKAEEFMAALEGTAKANATMRAFYEGRKVKFIVT